MTETASRVLMVRPRSFQSNTETSSTNAFQRRIDGDEVMPLALIEFEALRQTLVDHGVEVICYDEPADAKTPDAIFPNNWFAVLPNGQVFLFPMLAANRRREVHPAWVEPFLRKPPLVDLRGFCSEKFFLEGTGSLILNHNLKTGYACLSERTNPKAIAVFERLSGYRIFVFSARDRNGLAFYHTNVMMAQGVKTVVCCMESLSSPQEREKLSSIIKDAGQTVVEITLDQVLEFAGNMLLLRNKSNHYYWVCSTRAFKSLTSSQRNLLELDGRFITSDLTTIENVGGGSARCMLGELF